MKLNCYIYGLKCIYFKWFLDNNKLPKRYLQFWAPGVAHFSRHCFSFYETTSSLRKHTGLFPNIHSWCVCQLTEVNICLQNTSNIMIYDFKNAKTFTVFKEKQFYFFIYFFWNVLQKFTNGLFFQYLYISLINFFYILLPIHLIYIFFYINIYFNNLSMA